MKVTALVSDQLIETVVKITHGKNITESIVMALEDWVRIKKLYSLTEKIEKEPLRFKSKKTASSVRKLNRQNK